MLSGLATRKQREFLQAGRPAAHAGILGLREEDRVAVERRAAHAFVRGGERVPALKKEIGKVEVVGALVGDARRRGDDQAPVPVARQPQQIARPLVRRKRPLDEIRRVGPPVAASGAVWAVTIITYFISSDDDQPAMTS